MIALALVLALSASTYAAPQFFPSAQDQIAIQNQQIQLQGLIQQQRALEARAAGFPSVPAAVPGTATFEQLQALENLKNQQRQIENQQFQVEQQQALAHQQRAIEEADLISRIQPHQINLLVHQQQQQQFLANQGAFAPAPVAPSFAFAPAPAPAPVATPNFAFAPEAAPAPAPFATANFAAAPQEAQPLTEQQQITQQLQAQAFADQQQAQLDQQQEAQSRAFEQQLLQAAEVQQ